MACRRKDGRGGRRQGAGRPRMYGNELTRKISVSLPESLIETLTDEAEALSRQEGRRVSVSELVSECLLEVYTH